MISASAAEYDVQRQVNTYTGDVTITYGPTIVRADKIELHYSNLEKFGEASGNVTVTDPEGRMTASRFLFRWARKSGEADDVDLAAGGFRIRAKHIDIEPEERHFVAGKDGKAKQVVTPAKWTLTGVFATSCNRKIPVYGIQSDRITLTPGKSGVSEHTRFQLLGKTIFSWPKNGFSLDRRDKGFGLPGLARDRNGNNGITWAGGSLLDDRTAMDFAFGVFQQRLPTGKITVAHSFVPADGQSYPIDPISDVDERFNRGYFETVRIRSYESEAAFYRSERASVSISSSLNVTPQGRLEDMAYNRPAELIGEKSLRVGAFSLLAQTRIESVQPLRRATTVRSGTMLSALSPEVNLGKNLRLVSRFDFANFLSSKSDYGWIRGIAGLQYKPTRWLSIGAAYQDSLDFGTPQFGIDPLAIKSAFHGRVDFDFGPTKLSFLNKYDFRKRKIVDREFVASQVIGCVEFFYLIREFPRDTAVGLKLRAQDFFESLRSRKPKREASASKPTVISSKEKP